MALSDTALRNAKPTGKTRRIADSGGLYIEISPTGGKLWRFKYRFAGKEKRLALGQYPAVGLAKARKERDDAKELLAQKIDPSQHKKALNAASEDRAANSFEIVAREWFAKKEKTWAASHSSKIMGRLENYLFPYLGVRPIAELTAPEVLGVLRRIEARGAIETAHRALQIVGRVFRYAIATGRAERNIAPDLIGSLSEVKVKHRAAITDPKAVGGMLRAFDDYQGHHVTVCALRIAPLVFVRPTELRTMEWAELDLENAVWNIPAEKMKMKEPHLVPLSKQAVAILQDIQLLTGRGRYVFPSVRSPKRPMSDNAILSALRRMGFAKDEMSGHGFRAMARTILDEVLHVRPDFIEHQLAHAVRDPNGRAYNRTAHLAERKAMMQQWADYLEALKQGGNVIPMKRKADK